MLRRSFLGGSAALATLAASRAPAIAQSAAARTLRFVPFADLGSIDPIWTTGYTTRDHGFLVYDTLYGTDENFQIRPQMAAGHEVGADGKTVTIRLREGLKFHDGEAVRARDCVASLLRWSRRDSFGQAWAAVLDEARASDDRTMVFRLKSPFPTFFAALAKPSSNVAFMMPERIASTDPMRQITDATGSGPFRFLRDQWQAGVQAVYARNPDYVPRNEPASWTAGGKVAHLERVEWKIIRDATTAGAALQSGEIDWYDEVHPDLVPALRRNRNVRVAVRSRLGNFLIMRFNQLHPPFDKVAVRRAVMLAVDQAEYGIAAMGNDPELAKPCYSFFTCDTPMASEVGAEPLQVRSLDRAKAALASSGYNGERVILLSATEIPNVSASAQLTLQTLQRMGMNAEIVATDFATIIQRRANREPGAWNIFFTGWSGADVMNPAVNASLRGNGINAWPGWPTEPRLEALRAQWLVASDEAAQRRIAQEMQRVAFETVPYVPLSRIFLPSGFRANVEGVISAPPALFWNVRKT